MSLHCNNSLPNQTENPVPGEEEAKYQAIIGKILENSHVQKQSIRKTKAILVDPSPYTTSCDLIFVDMENDLFYFYTSFCLVRVW